jgi:hypothetical protein
VFFSLDRTTIRVDFFLLSIPTLFFRLTWDQRFHKVRRPKIRTKSSYSTASLAFGRIRGIRLQGGMDVSMFYTTKYFSSRDIILGPQVPSKGEACRAINSSCVHRSGGRATEQAPCCSTSVEIKTQSLSP